ncbi:hypothetical protein [Mangrovibacterium lignilyticum]|uniref:hypothetical protein n=1 Tax=Mangrovibacterium lignilyticum TaxID=2668052 RepID=UPI0013D3B52B|nr:hypothetical protein [Mangrovibacterium lignilyticum]
MFEGGAGHIADMISRLKANRNPVRKRKHFGENEEGFIHFGSHLELKYKEGSEADKQRIMKQIKADLKRQSRLEKSMLVLSIVLFIVAFGWFARNFI